MAKDQSESWFQRNWKWALPLYVLLLIASHAVQTARDGKVEPEPPRSIVETEGKRLGYLEWGTQHGGIPLILLHGSPGSGASDFNRLGAKLAQEKRWVIAIDRWGYGSSEKWVEDYSFLSDARAVMGLMDQLGIKEAHIGGWSYGGGPALILAQQEPVRIKSITMIAAIGAQKGEGSGSYAVEQTKYTVGYPLLMGLGELVPHFGLLGDRATRHAFMRDFRDCDQRGLDQDLKLMSQPLLILHGKNDPLVPAWLAQEHHEMQPKSRLVMLDASHFFLFGGESNEALRIAVEEIGGFLKAVDQKAPAGMGQMRNETSWQDFHVAWSGGPLWRGYKPVWAVAAVSLVAAFIIPRLTALLAGVGGGLLLFDPVTALVTALVGGALRQREGIRRGRMALVQIGIGLFGSMVGAGVMAVL